MNVGMLWFDNDPRIAFIDKIESAVVYCQKKYGYVPDVCFVNPRMLIENHLENSKIPIKPLKVIQPWNFWFVKKDL